MKRVRLLPYNMGSGGCKNLSQFANFPRIRKENSAYKYREGDLIINWGCSQRPPHIPEEANVFNSFDAVAVAVDKFKTFESLESFGVAIPDWTDDKEIAHEWLLEGFDVVVRETVKGHGGEGLSIIEQNHLVDMDEDEIFEMIPNAPLFTKYIPKKKEYRVHVFKHQVIDLTRKALHPDVNPQNVNWKVRNHDNGFIFVRNTDQVDRFGFPIPEYDVAPQCVKSVAVKSILALGLDFGAVDVIYNKRRDMAYVLEVNTAPGIEGTTVERYKSAIELFLD